MGDFFVVFGGEVVSHIIVVYIKLSNTTPGRCKVKYKYSFLTYKNLSTITSKQ